MEGKEMNFNAQMEQWCMDMEKRAGLLVRLRGVVDRLKDFPPTPAEPSVENGEPSPETPSLFKRIRWAVSAGEQQTADLESIIQHLETVI